MRVIFEAEKLVLIPESDEERAAALAWRPGHDGHLFFLNPMKGDVLALRDHGPQAGASREPFTILSQSWDPAAQEGHVFLLARHRQHGVVLRDLGHRREACREPFPVLSGSASPAARLISNFALTPFELDGRAYQSVEGFWQGLKFDDEAERQRVAQLHGADARRAGRSRPYGAAVRYEGQSFAVGTWEHWRLMYWACRAKFRQHETARAALLSTGERPLVHPSRQDSKTIPGVVMADIWTRIRRKLRKAARGTRSERGNP